MPTTPVRLAFAMLVAALSTASAHAANDALLAAARTEQQPTLATLEQLVSFDSGTLNGDGFRKVAYIAEPRLQALGFATERIDATPWAGVNLVGRLDGKGTKKLLLLAHMDTVYLDGTAGVHANSDEFVVVDRIPARPYLAAELMKRVLSSLE